MPNLELPVQAVSKAVANLVRLVDLTAVCSECQPDLTASTRVQAVTYYKSNVHLTLFDCINYLLLLIKYIIYFSS